MIKGVLEGDAPLIFDNNLYMLKIVKLLHGPAL